MKLRDRLAMRRYSRMCDRLGRCLDDGHALVIRREDGKLRVMALRSVEARTEDHVEVLYADSDPRQVITPGGHVTVTGELGTPPWFKRVGVM